MELDAIIKELHKEVDYERYHSCADKTVGATDCPSCCGDQYYDDLTVTYVCEQKRKIYVLRYLPVHVHENYSAALLIPEELRSKLLSQKVVKVLSLGGGPGSDIAGFKKFIGTLDEEECQCRNFKIVRLDKEVGWNDLSGDIVTLYEDNQRTFENKRNQVDVCQADATWFNGKTFDFVLISYLISELRQETQIEMLVSNLKKCLTKDSILIINDRAQNKVGERILKFAASLGFQQIKSKPLSDWACFSYDGDIKRKAKPKLSATSKARIFQNAVK